MIELRSQLFDRVLNTYLGSSLKQGSKEMTAAHNHQSPDQTVFFNQKSYFGSANKNVKQQELPAGHRTVLGQLPTRKLTRPQP